MHSGLYNFFNLQIINRYRQGLLWYLNGIYTIMNIEELDAAISKSISTNASQLNSNNKYT